MSFLNLGLGELIGLFSAVSGILVALYLLDRSRRRQVVATLRFWKPAETATEMRQKRRIQQPWSLVLQVVSMLLLLLAIAQMQWGSLERTSRDHILILDTSAWMGARTARGTLMDDARAAALAYVRAVPSSDRILLVRADGLATPVTLLETNHTVVERAIRESKPSSSALNLDQALEFAQRAQSGQAGIRRAGEIVYAGAGRINASDGVPPKLPNNLRVLSVRPPGMPADIENCGIRRIGLRRTPGIADQWEVFLSTRNYGVRQQVVQLAIQFGGAPIGSRTLTLKPGTELESTFAFRTKAAGWIEARLLHDDAFPEDNRVMLEVPAQHGLRVTVYTDQPELLRPVLSASSRVMPTFRPPSAYETSPDADAVIFDRFVPPAPTKLPSIWIEPPAQRSPVAVRTVLTNGKLTRWNADHELGAGLRTKDVQLDSAEVFAPAQGDVTVAESGSGPVIIARPQTATNSKLVVLGFNPARSSMRNELAMPLLFANVLRWMSPEIFRRWELNGGTVGTVEADLGKKTDPATVRVISDDGKPVPYTVNGDHLRFFAGNPGNVRIQTGDREIVYSLTLPEVGASEWTVPANVRRGIPRFRGEDAPVTDLWPWLAAAGALGLLIEWILWGRGRSAGRILRAPSRAGQRVLQRRAS